MGGRLIRQSIEDLSGRILASRLPSDLRFPDHPNKFNTGKRALSTEEILKPEHWFDNPLDQPVVLLNYIV